MYRRRFRAFLATVTAFLGDADAARDVVQESFACALARRDDYTGSGALEAWLWRIVVNRALDQRRSHARTRAVPETDVARAAASPRPTSMNKGPQARAFLNSGGRI